MAPTNRPFYFNDSGDASRKRWTKEVFGDPEWDFQPSGFDRLLRRQENAQNKWEYMRNNPVRAGLVKDWQEWP
ncbi:MAG: hypothetical protein GWM87_13760, partial [Xanthomonadales bacterium]|nr:hypothetical protein [Xanthomonadales bacterium]NIX13880.1 hypothetical protein [Xanthomonadales bacterium]